jgi:hypothetical protein
MAVNLCGDHIEIFKFEESGLVELCGEVAYTVADDSAAYRLKPETARYEKRDGLHVIIIDQYAKGDPEGDERYGKRA